jgi:hypothetical protein
MNQNEILESIAAFCAKLCQELSGEDLAAGWTDAKRLDLLQYFQKLEQRVVSNEPIPYIALIRTLDSVGISEGSLLDEACGIINAINARQRK